VDDAARLEGVAALGLDETSFLRATRTAPTRWVTGLVDLEGGRLLDVVADRTRAAVAGWLGARPPGWLAHIGTVALDPWRGYASALVAPLGHATVVVDHFHAIRLANTVVDQVRRRTQQATLGHRGRTQDPLYRIRKLLLTGSERLDDKGQSRMLLGLRIGDPYDEVAGAWLAKESVRDVYLTEDPADAATLLDKAIVGCLGDDVAEIRTLGGTLARWRTEILNHHHTGASNGPTEGLNLVIKKVKRAGHGFHTYDHYRLRCLLHAGGVNWPNRPSPPRIRTRRSLLR
jgi:transposase